MFSTAIRMQPAATPCGVCGTPVARSMSAASVRNCSATTPASNGESPRFAEHGGKELRLNSAEQHVAIGDGQRSAAPIRRWTWIRSGRLRPHSQPHAIELADRAAACRDGMDLHQRRAQPDTGNFSVERPLVFAGEVRDVGRRAAHVEADDLVDARLLRRARGADDAARGAGENRVLAVELLRIGEPAGRLHELQLHARQLRGNLIHVAAQNRRQICIDDCRVAARDQLHQRADLMRDRDLRETDAPRELFQLQLVLVIAIAVEQRDRARSDPSIERGAQVALRLLQIERTHDLAVRADDARRSRRPARTASKAARCAARTAWDDADNRCAARPRSRA